MGWRKILEDEHRLVLEVIGAAETECGRIEADGCANTGLISDMLEFFRYFNDGLHDPKEEGLLFARCHKRGMTDDDEPLEQMLGEHEWCRGQLDALQATLHEMRPGEGAVCSGFARRLREYVEVVRCHIEVEETVFFDTAQHYLTERDRRELTEEFEAVHYDEIEEGVQAFWGDLAHRVSAAEREGAAERRTA